MRVIVLKTWEDSGNRLEQAEVCREWNRKGTFKEERIRRRTSSSRLIGRFVTPFFPCPLSPHPRKSGLLDSPLMVNWTGRAADPTSGYPLLTFLPSFLLLLPPFLSLFHSLRLCFLDWSLLGWSTCFIGATSPDRSNEFFNDYTPSLRFSSFPIWERGIVSSRGWIVISTRSLFVCLVPVISSWFDLLF